MNYLIIDKTTNTGRCYIDHNFTNCELEKNAMVFKNKSCAEAWATVQETELKAYY